jgi:hypothetical protein
MYAIIENGRVVNIVMADAETATANGWIASTGASIGDTWDGTGFARPAKYPDLATGKEMRLQELAARRYEAEEGGTTLGGNPLATDRITQSKLTAAYVKAVADDGFQITAWKSGPGVFSTLTAATIIAAANAIEAHVQACFDNEKTISTEIADAADLAELAAVDIEGGW